MKISRFFICPALFVATLVSAAPSQDQVVNDALQAIEMCLHWSGETGSGNAEREQQVAEGVGRDCPVARNKAHEAYTAYPNDERLFEPLLSLDDFDYFDLPREQKDRLCESAIPIFKRKYKESKNTDVLFQFECPAQAAKIYSK